MSTQPGWLIKQVNKKIKAGKTGLIYRWWAVSKEDGHRKSGYALTYKRAERKASRVYHGTI